MTDELSVSGSGTPPPDGSVPTPVAYAVTPATPVATIGRLTKIEIENYRAFRGSFRLDLPKGENLLIYGENGAGKSSLYHTLRVFLEAPDWHVKDAATGKHRPVIITDHQHRFTTQAPTIKLEFGAQSLQWSETINDTDQAAVRLLNQGKGFLDYKALLEVHYYRFDEGVEIDLFPLFIRKLLPYYTYPSRGKSLTFQNGWSGLQRLVKQRWTGSRGKDFQDNLNEFNDALERMVQDLGVRTSDMLTAFGDEFAAGFHFERAEFKVGPKRIEGPRILARPAFRKEQIPDYHGFFNEARLSALAICIFFAALKDSPATGLRILALDDVLIGLDMSNRLTVLDLVHKHFNDWQILIYTYSKAWFELLKERIHLTGWAAEWKAVIFFEEKRDEDNSPFIVAVDSGNMLHMAESHLHRKDYKAAAVYARSALEALCHHTCAKAALHVLFVDDHKKRKLEDYIDVLERRLGELSDENRRNEALLLISRLREARAFVLNRKSHFDVEEEDTLSAEVGAAIQTVKDLSAFLDKQNWKRSNFKEGKELTITERLMIELSEARKLASVKGYGEAAKKLASAHDLAWQNYGALMKVFLPIGTALSARSIWDAALAQSKLAADLDSRLKTARPYLFGSVQTGDFDASKFEEATKLIEELVAHPPPGAQP